MGSRDIQRKGGFSMVEMIIVLVIVSVMGALAGSMFTPVIQGTVAGAQEMHTAEDSYWAVTRMTSICGLAIDVQTPTSQRLRVGFLGSGGVTNWSEFAFANGQLQLDSVLFWDDIHSFSASYANKLIQMDIKLVDADHPTLNVDVFARNAP